MTYPPAPSRYAKWLAHVFSRKVTEPAWYHRPHRPFEASVEETSALIRHTLLNCRRDLAQYSDDQVGLGLRHLFDASCGNVVFAVRDKSIPKPEREETVAAIATLYTDCFEPRCAPALGHRDEALGNKLNSICYMLWDVTPLRSASPATLEVLSVALASKNPACQESALHGLGHLHPSEAAGQLIRDYVATRKPVGALRAYAELAAKGRVL